MFTRAFQLHPSLLIFRATCPLLSQRTATDTCCCFYTRTRYPDMGKSKYINPLGAVDHWLGTWGGMSSTACRFLHQAQCRFPFATPIAQLPGSVAASRPPRPSLALSYSRHRSPYRRHTPFSLAGCPVMPCPTSPPCHFAASAHRRLQDHTERTVGIAP